MASEATVRSSLNILVGKLNYQSQPTTFRANVSTGLGPTPGVIAVPVTGINVDLSALSYPGLARFMNLDATNYVIYGIYDLTSFFPLGEILPGETYVLRLWRSFGDEFLGTGTGTPADDNRLHFRADTATCRVLVEAFER